MGKILQEQAPDLNIYTDSKASAIAYDVTWIPRDRNPTADKLAKSVIANPLQQNIRDLFEQTPLQKPYVKKTLEQVIHRTEVESWPAKLGKLGYTCHYFLSEFDHLEHLRGILSTRALRLIQGHNNLPKHLWLRGVPRQGVNCPRCRVPLNAIHLVRDCERTLAHREMFLKKDLPMDESIGSWLTPETAIDLGRLLESLAISFKV